MRTRVCSSISHISPMPVASVPNLCVLQLPATLHQKMLNWSCVLLYAHLFLNIKQPARFPTRFAHYSRHIYYYHWDLSSMYSASSGRRHVTKFTTRLIIMTTSFSTTYCINKNHTLSFLLRNSNPCFFAVPSQEKN